ncbi:MAG TPA: NAD(P)/FAD-dependent oxidoreductase [Flavisolibacter sp.]
MTPDIIIIGAGASGLLAAVEAAKTGKSVAIIEARDRCGGRIHTMRKAPFSMPVETGAEFVHGNAELTKLLLKKAGATTVETAGTLWMLDEDGLREQDDFVTDYRALSKKLKEPEQDIPVKQFIQQYLQEDSYESLRKTLANYVEGYYAADTGLASTFALREELSGSGDSQLRITGGYQQLIRSLEQDAKQHSVPVFLSQPVQEIRCSDGAVDIITAGETFHGKRAIVTIPAGTLRSGAVRFDPFPRQHMDALHQLGFGPVIKVLLEFTSAFWRTETRGKDLSDAGFIFSQQAIPTWWTQHPDSTPLLTGWAAGPNAQRLDGYSEAQLLDDAVGSLAVIFNRSSKDLRNLLRAFHIARWPDHPYTCGGYSYEVVGGRKHQEFLETPFMNVLYFAGEHLYKGRHIGTVEGALASGRETVHRVIASF